jgi:predicted GNAT superfamily acetyltransferase
LLKVTRRVGGVVAGAFVDGGEAAGFVFGLTGVNGGGRLVHWSHMLAVAPRYRDRGVGRQLKRFQWETLRSMGVETAQWTFDPLVARNAHLNVNRLGATLSEYVPDMYADTGSGLHAFGTDRFVVTWRIEGSGPAARSAEGDCGGPRVNVDDEGSPVAVPLETGERTVRIEVPADIEPLMEADIESLRRWRVSTRAAFERYLGSGYGVAGFVRGAVVGWYILEAGAGSW